MSEVEYHFGKLRLLPQNPEDTEEDIMLRILEGKSKPKWANNTWEWFQEACAGKYIFHDGKVYEVEDHVDLYMHSIQLVPLPDGSISYTTCFHNGGTYLEEMLTKGIERLRA